MTVHNLPNLLTLVGASDPNGDTPLIRRFTDSPSSVSSPPEDTPVANLGSPPSLPVTISSLGPGGDGALTVAENGDATFDDNGNAANIPAENTAFDLGTYYFSVWDGTDEQSLIAVVDLEIFNAVQPDSLALDDQMTHRIESNFFADGSTITGIGSQPTIGRANIGHDGAMHIVLSEESGNAGASDSVTVAVDLSGGGSEERAISYEIVEGLNDKVHREGWALPFWQYNPPLDGAGLSDRDDSTFEPGPGHETLYFSGSGSAWTASAIAAEESMTSGQVTGTWLRNQSFYGRSSDEPLAPDLWAKIFSNLLDRRDVEQRVSAWLHFERGYGYDFPVIEDLVGYSPRSPVAFFAYGAGADPIVHGVPYYCLLRGQCQNIVFKGFYFSRSLKGDQEIGVRNVMLEDCDLREWLTFSAANETRTFGITVRRCKLLEAFEVNPSNDGTHITSDFISNAKANSTWGFLLEWSYFDQGGMQYPYDWHGRTNAGLAADSLPPLPSGKGHNPQYGSHSTYFQKNSSHGTARYNIFSRGSQNGAHFRAGAFVHDNAQFLCSGFTVGGGREDDFLVSCIPQIFRNVITQDGMHEHDDEHSNSTKNWQHFEHQSTDHPCAIAWQNLAINMDDMDNPEAPPPEGQVVNAPVDHWWRRHRGVTTPTWNQLAKAACDATSKYRYIRSNIDAAILDATLDQLTLRRYTASRLAVSLASTTVWTLPQWLRTKTTAEMPAEVIAMLRWFQSGAGIAQTPEVRTTATSQSFMPSGNATAAAVWTEYGDHPTGYGLTDGLRADNPFNWSGNDVPISGDDCDLYGAHVMFPGTYDLDELDLGGGKALAVSGRLSATTLVGPGTIGADYNGEVHLGDWSGASALDVIVRRAGRFVNTGTISDGVSLDVTFESLNEVEWKFTQELGWHYNYAVQHTTVFEADVLLAWESESFTLASGRTMRITGSTGRIGVDGTAGGAATITLAAGSTLTLVGDSGGFAEFAEFQSGRNRTEDTDPNVASTLALAGALVLDISGVPDGTYTIATMDTVSGSWSGVTVPAQGQRDVTITVGATTITVLIEPGDGTLTVA